MRCLPIYTARAPGYAGSLIGTTTSTCTVRFSSLFQRNVGVATPETASRSATCLSTRKKTGQRARQIGGVIRPFNSADLQIDVFSASVSSSSSPVLLSITRTSADIAYVIIAGQSAQNPVNLDNLRFNLVEVAEPTALGLLLAAGLAMPWLRSRRFG